MQIERAENKMGKASEWVVSLFVTSHEDFQVAAWAMGQALNQEKHVLSKF